MGELIGHVLFGGGCGSGRSNGMIFLEFCDSRFPMINNHNYYNALETSDLVELLAEATQRYSQASATGESERTLDSYRELMGLLHTEIQQRHALDCAKNSSPEPGHVIPAHT